MQTVQQTEIEQIHEDVGTPDVSVEGVTAERGVSIEGADTLHAELGETARGTEVRDFACVKCGIVHGHDTNKHRVSDSDGVSVDEATSMDYNPNCHCGYNEAAHRGMVGASPQKAASRAPIPDNTRREMASQF